MATINDVHNAQPGSLLLIDIRKNPDDLQIPGSTRYDGAALEQGDDIPFSKDDRVVLYCGSGNSCSRVAATLRERGYVHAEALDGGYKAWTDARLPVEPRQSHEP